jgi:hypothetical protein
MKFQLIASFLIASLFFISCKKTETTPKTKTELLAGTASKTWKINSAIAKEGTLELNLINSQPTCRIDNTLILSSNKTYEIREGATKCATTDPDLVVKANWELSADEKTVTLDKLVLLGFEFNKPAIKIIELTQNSLKGETAITFQGKQYTLIAGFVPAN